MSLEQALQHQVQLLCRGDNDSVNDETLRSIRLTILTRAAQILHLPFDPTDSFRSVDFSNRIVLSPDTFKALDKAWSRIACTFADNRISNQEKQVRERLFFNAPYYADKTQLIRFINILSKRDSTYSLFTARHEVARSTPFSLLKTTLLNRILAIDGFRGILPWQCRNYTNHLSDRLPVLDKIHLEAIRTLYASEFFVDGRHSGTIAAGLVLLALLKLYGDRVGHRMDRATRHVVDKAVECVSNVIDDRDGSGDFVLKKHRKRCIGKIAKRYRKKVNDDALLEGIAFRKLVDYGKCALSKYLP